MRVEGDGGGGVTREGDGGGGIVRSRLIPWLAITRLSSRICSPPQ
jgi:hypothetical protein